MLSPEAEQLVAVLVVVAHVPGAADHDPAGLVATSTR